MLWHNLEKEEIFSKLKSSEEGISNKEAAKRLKTYGKNELKDINKENVFILFLKQFKSILILVLLFAAIFSLIINHILDFLVIIAIVILNGCIGFFHEYKAEKIIDKMKTMLIPQVKVIREGSVLEIPSYELVPGDILILSEGDKLTADLRILESNELKINESIITGESLPQDKTSKVLRKDLILGERKNIAYAGTSIVSGNGRGIVIKTGMASEFGSIAGLVQNIKEDSAPLEKKIEKLSKKITFICLGVIALIILIGLIKEQEFSQMILIGVSLAVSIIPEGLPAVISLILAIAIKKMHKYNALIRKLPAAETLGRTTLICTDKTGTLTDEEISVVKIYYENKSIDIDEKNFFFNNKKINPKSEKSLMYLLKTGILCNNARIEKDEVKDRIFGDSTEKALIISAQIAGISKKEETEKEKRVKEFSFSSDRKFMSVVRQVNGKYINYVKGAPDIILKKCSKEMIKGKLIKIDEKRRREINHICEEMSSEALRILAFAYKEVPEKFGQIYAENNLVFLGFQGMLDKPRKGVKEAIKECIGAGIKVKMITGDSESTAKAIAKLVGLNGDSIDIKELEKLSKEEFIKIVKEKNIFAKINPEMKFKIVKTLRESGETVAVTGDGVNDTLALKEADIGVAMGIRGTDVSREVSDIVLLDDNFKTIVKAVREGRKIYENLKKVIKASLSANIGELFIISFAIISSMPLPILPLGLLWVNLITDSFPILALGFEKEDENIMKRKPKDFDEDILQKIIRFVLVSGIVSCLISLILFFSVYKIDIDKARTFALTSLVFEESFIDLSCRSEDKSIKKLGILTNKPLLFSVIISAVLQIALIYSPFSSIFGLKAISFAELVIVFFSSSLIFLFFELAKILKIKI